MATEKQLQQGIRNTVRGISGFEDSSVQINRDVFLDWSTDYSPFFNILDADTFNYQQGATAVYGSIEIPAILYVVWENWEDAQNDFRDRRQDIVDAHNATGTARSAGGLDGVNITEIRSDGPMIPVTYDDDPDAFPIFLMQALVFHVELF